jgi:hypothetical protein
VGFAISQLDEAEAMRTYRLLEKLGQLSELGPPPEILGGPKFGNS